MAAGRIVISEFAPARDRNDALVAGAKMFVYTNGTTTLASIYTSAALTTALANPVVANSSGQFAQVWADASLLYTVSITGPNGESIGNPSVFDDYSPSTNFAVSQVEEYKAPVRVASTANITIASALINGSTIDGVVVATGDRVLLKDQSTGSQNGIYVVVASGAASRAGDADTTADVASGMTMFVSEGTANGGAVFTLTTANPIVLGTTALVFSRYAGIGILPIANGGTGASDASTARTNLGLGSIATQAASSVAITGGSITGITDLAVADGGTGASDASGARTNLGLVIGTNVQAYDPDLTTWASITPGTGVATALAVNVGSAGAPVLFNGAGGTPSSLTLTNATGLPVAGGGTGAATAADARTNLAVVGTAALAASGGSALVGYLQAGTGATATTVQAKLRGNAISTADWGITADSNGTTGNGTDWTTQLQALVTYARANGRNIWVPAKPGFFIRFTGTINFEGAQTKMEVIGESNFDSAFFADFTSTSAIAAFSNNASSGSRSYVAWRNFRLLGRSDTTSSNTVRGIYSNWGGEFTEFESVFVAYFYDNVVISNDYDVKIARCLFWYAKNDNLQIGRDITGATGACNLVNIDGTHATYAGQYGVYVYACRAIQISGGGAEGNHQGNLFLDSVYGGNVSGYYMEYGSAESGNPTSQLRFRNCSGCTVNGLSVSAFDNSGNPVVYLDEGNNGITLNGLAIETAGANTSAIAVHVYNSFGVTINGGYFDGLTSGIYLTGSSRVTINACNIDCTTPVSTNASACQLTWMDAIPAQVTASVASINALAAVDIVRNDRTKNQIDTTKAFNVGASFSNLAAGATVKIIDAELLSEQWRISEIAIEVIDAFSGGGGDRNIAVRTAATVYTAMPSASLTVYGTRGRWSDTAVPYGAADTFVTATAANADLYLQYSGGAADYTAGIVVVRVVATRIA